MTLRTQALFLSLAVGPSLHAQPAPPALTGTIRLWGSPQMADLLHQYESGFLRLHPQVHFDEQLKSTVSAVAGVYTGRADIGLLGREIWPTEVEAFRTVTGRSPAVLEVATGAYDVPKATFALMLFVPQANPIPSLTLAQLRLIFSSTPTRPALTTWGQLGLTGTWASRPIHPYGFTVENDKSQVFRQMVFSADARWTAGLRESANTPTLDAGQAITTAVAQDPDAIGISNVHYLQPGLRMLAITPDGAAAAIAPTRASVAARTYPLTRAISFVLDRDPAVPPSPDVAAFLAYVLSPAGAEAVRREGNYLPLPPALAQQQLQLLTRKQNAPGR